MFGETLTPPNGNPWCFYRMPSTTMTDTLQFIQQHLNDDIRKLALKRAPEGVDLPMALQQITARQMLAHKVPTWAANSEMLFPPRLNIEQCSSEWAARYKTTLVSGGQRMADLTGGTGVDCWFLQQKYQSAIYVDRNPELCNLMQHNASVTHANIEVWNDDAEEALKRISQPLDLLFIDPARRDDAGKKTVLLQHCSPNIVPMWEMMLEKAEIVMVKLSPMLDIALSVGTLTHISQVHVVSVNDECKELLLIANRQFSGTPTLHCVELKHNPQSLCFDAITDAEPIASATEVGSFLFEPHPTVMKAGMFHAIAHLHHIHPLDPNTHLFTAETPCDNFFGRRFKVDAVVPFNKKCRSQFPEDYSNAAVAVRNFPLGADALRKQLKVGDSSERFIFGVTMNGNRLLILCRKAS